MNSKHSRIDPRWRDVVADQKKTHLVALVDEDIAALILAHGDLDSEHLRQLGVKHVVRLTDSIWSIRFPRDVLQNLNDSPLIHYIEAPARLAQTLVHSVAAIRARPQDIGATLDGKDVVIGIVDYGIDWTLSDFCDDQGQTRIKSLWDQSLDAKAGEQVPRGFAHGVEYREHAINAALATFRQGNVPAALAMVRHRPWPAKPKDATDVDGHGTHVAGIACGNGASSSVRCFDCPPSAGKYHGVAPRAWIVFVHLCRKRILQGVEEGGGLGNSADLAEAIVYCYRRADEISVELGRRVPCVVNLSMGFNAGSHDGESLVERVIDSVLENRGRALVVAAGNERQQRTHHVGAVQANTPYVLLWNMGYGDEADPTLNEMEIWYSSRDQVNVKLVDPHGNASPAVKPGQRITCNSYDDATMVIDSERFTYLNSDARIYLRVTPAAGKRLRGQWRVELTCNQPLVGMFDAWIEKEVGQGIGTEGDPKQSRFPLQYLEPGHRATTLTIPATSRRAIAVGAVGRLDRGVPRLLEDSGGGPTRDGRPKPELVAPGIAICSNNVRFDRTPSPACAQVQKSGTSMACPHVAGVVALMLQMNPELTAAQVQKILVASAEQRGGGKHFDPLWGFGVVNARQALELVCQSFASQSRAD